MVVLSKTLSSKHSTSFGGRERRGLMAPQREEKIFLWFLAKYGNYHQIVISTGFGNWDAHFSGAKGNKY
jgi:hypothetical protein